jgi:hypothetical protein
MDERREEKLIYRYISKNENEELKRHLELHASKLEDITKIFDKSGYSCLHFAAFKNYESICYTLAEFILNRKKIPSPGSSSIVGGVEMSVYSLKLTGTGEQDEDLSPEEKEFNREKLREWINQPS